MGMGQEYAENVVYSDFARTLERRLAVAVEALKAAKEQLEEWEVTIDGEWGRSRTLQELESACELSDATIKVRAALHEFNSL